MAAAAVDRSSGCCKAAVVQEDVQEQATAAVLVA
jgi:hypothetical protein